MSSTTNPPYLIGNAKATEFIICQLEGLKPVKVLEGPLRKMEDHTFEVRQVLFLPDGRLASCSNDWTVRVWDTQGRRAPIVLKGHSNWVLAVALLPNGWLASASSDLTIKMWDLEAKKEVRTLRGHTSAIVSLRALRNGNLASFSHDGTIKIWNTNSNESILTITANKGSVVHFPLFDAFLNDFLATCSRKQDDNRESELQIWNSNDGQMVKSIPTGLKDVKALLVLSNGQVAIGAEKESSSSKQNGVIQIFDWEQGKRTRITNKAHDLQIDCLLQLPSSGYLVSAGQDKLASASIRSIKVWDLFDLRSPLLIITTGHTSTIHSLSVLKDETMLASASADSTIHLWLISTKTVHSG